MKTYWKFIFKILAIIIWLVTIFKFSSQASSESLDLSNKFMYKVVSILENKELSKEKKEQLSKKYTLYVRKSAHFFLYFVLGILIFWLFCDIIKIHSLLVLLTIASCCLYAMSDEWHQKFVDGRTARLFDVIVDTGGATLSTTFMFMFYKDIETSKYKKETNRKISELEDRIIVLEGKDPVKVHEEEKEHKRKKVINKK